MSELKSGSRATSKSNLNESSLPLLEDVEKDIMELKEKASIGSEAEKDDSNPEKTEGEEKKDEEETKKGKKEKKERRPRRERPAERSLVESLTIGLNVLDRDDKHVNDTVNINFEDVIAEPDSAHGFDPIWRAVFIVFTGVKYWTYRFLTLFLAIPLALIWGVVFTLITFLHVWVFTPFLRVLDVLLSVVKRVWSAVISTVFEPIAMALGACLSGIRVTHHQNPAATSSV